MAVEGHGSVENSVRFWLRILHFGLGVLKLSVWVLDNLCQGLGLIPSSAKIYMEGVLCTFVTFK